jgi:type IV pilus assembly protein PilY1
MVSSTVATTNPQVLIEFGTGKLTQLTNLSPAQYASGTQAMYGIWDWNMSAWNTLEPGATYSSLSPAATGLAAPYTMTSSNLTAQTLAEASDNVAVVGTNVPVCWQGSLTACGTGTFGWYENLPNANEQIIYSPVYYGGAFIVNSIVPANNIATSCTNNLDQGYTYVLNIANGGTFTGTFSTFTTNGIVNNVTNVNGVAGVLSDATGSSSIVSNQLPGTSSSQGVPLSAGTSVTAISSTTGGGKSALPLHLPSNTKAKRLTWIERR